MITVGIPSFGTDSGKSGIGSYLRELLLRFDDEKFAKEYHFELIGPKKDRDVYLSGTSRISWHEVEGADSSPIHNFFWNQFSLPSLCKKRKYDVLFLPAANRRLCAYAPCPVVGTVHDLATLHIKNKYDFSHAVFNRKMLPFLIRRLDHILTVSQFSKNDIVQFAKVDPDLVTVTHLAADAKRFVPPKDKNKVREYLAQKFGIDNPYILYISRLEHPGKNHANLIRAFELYKKESGSPSLLVLPGPDKERAQEIHALAEASVYAKDIRFLGFIDTEDVPLLYQGSDLFVLPSFFEGFGLPVLEAMACSTVVITSSAASLPEVSGPHTPHFDPTSPTEMAEAMKEALLDEKTRETLAKKSVACAKTFSWDKTVKQTLEAIQSVRTR